jgi:hypothetical protein
LNQGGIHNFSLGSALTRSRASPVERRYAQKKNYKPSPLIQKPIAQAIRASGEELRGTTAKQCRETPKTAGFNVGL